MLIFCCEHYFVRPIKGLCGFSRESVVAITTNVESIEFRRRQNDEIGYEEHPRAGTTDDVEAFFALLHRYLGVIFTLKDFKALWRKLLLYFGPLSLQRIIYDLQNLENAQYKFYCLLFLSTENLLRGLEVVSISTTGQPMKGFASGKMNCPHSMNAPRCLMMLTLVDTP